MGASGTGPDEATNRVRGGTTMGCCGGGKGKAAAKPAEKKEPAKKDK